MLFGPRFDQAHDGGQHAPRLRRQLVQAAPEHFMRYRVGCLDVGQRRLDVLDAAAGDSGGLHLALVLVQQRDRVDQAQVLLVIAPRPRAVIEEGQPVGIRVHHR